jgi:hypothetical protein
MKRSRFKEEQIIAILQSRRRGARRRTFAASTCRRDLLQVEGEVRRSRRVGCQAAVPRSAAPACEPRSRAFAKLRAIRYGDCATFRRSTRKCV